MENTSLAHDVLAVLLDGSLRNAPIYERPEVVSHKETGYWEFYWRGFYWSGPAKDERTARIKGWIGYLDSLLAKEWVL